MRKMKKLLISVLSGSAILFVTWMFQNYDYTLALEDAFFKKVFLVKDKIYSPPPRQTAHFVFINTGKDLALVEDSVDYGNVAISDREKIYRLMKQVNSMEMGPDFCVLDIQFYYPYSVEPSFDTLLQQELSKNDKVLVPILKNAQGKYIPPLYKAMYGYSDYRTFGATFNKFRIMNHEEISSIPILMHEKINGARYRDHLLWPTYNNSVCLAAIWPTYYVKDSDIRKTYSGESIADIENSGEPKQKDGRISTEYYNIGELLYDMEGSPENFSTAFANKILIVGNFQEDTHVTPIGKIAGPVLLANIYLSLLNGQHRLRFWLVALSLAALSGLSYVAIYKKMPEVDFNFKFRFSTYIGKFIREYISYFGAMFLLSLLALFIFNVQVALFLPSLIFTGIAYIKEKKYLNLIK